MNLTIPFYFWIILSLFLYQNCGQEDSSNISTDNSQQFQQSSELGSFDDTRPLILKVEQTEVEMELSLGQILNSQNPAWEGSCLNAEKLSEIKNLMSGNSLCETFNEKSPDTFCAQVYTFPYLELFVDKSKVRYKVGEKINSCPDSLIHFCDDDELIEAFFRSLDFNNDFEDCP